MTACTFWLINNKKLTVGNDLLQPEPKNPGEEYSGVISPQNYQSELRKPQEQLMMGEVDLNWTSLAAVQVAILED